MESADRSSSPTTAPPGHGAPWPDRIVDEQRLLEELRAGRESAFETMVRVYGGRLLAVARRITHNDDDALDVVQSTYLSAFRALATFEGACQLSTWLHRIAVNTPLMRLRSRRRRAEEPIETLRPGQQGRHLGRLSEWTTPADQLLERQRTRATVRACIDQLPDRYRAVLILRDIEELSTREAADTLAMTPAAVKVRLHRARQALSALLDLRSSPRFLGLRHAPHV
jgi:RNA polymerase sigma-70 factor, ECF subfamily